MVLQPSNYFKAAVFKLFFYELLQGSLLTQNKTLAEQCAL